MSGQHVTSIVIFGASGDLTRRKLIPALYNLYRKGRLPEHYQIIGVSRTEYAHEEFRDRLYENAKEFTGETLDDERWGPFAERIFYVPGNAKEQGDYERLDQFLKEQENGPANRLYYLSTAPSLYEPTIDLLGKAGMVAEAEGWRRVIIEKPFGYDLKSAQDLNEQVNDVFDEHQVYRIDHYLGKETAQNVLFMRFANTIFEPVWNRHYIDHVQITVAESVGVGHRADYYDRSGVVRDMFQNHLLQLLALIAMEPPNTLDADAIRNERVKLLKAVREIDLSDAVPAQYAGYRDEEGVDDDSRTPTFAAVKLFVDNWRWKDVPFYLRSGKLLKKKVSEIAVHFKQPALMMFDLPHDSRTSSDVLSLCIQPDEGAHLTVQAKLPDAREGRPVNLEFHYRDSFEEQEVPEAYERLLLDALLGDAALFTRRDGIERAWEIVDPLISAWEQGKGQPMATYTPGTWGPSEAEDLLDIDGHYWWVSCCDH